MLVGAALPPLWVPRPRVIGEGAAELRLCPEGTPNDTLSCPWGPCGQGQLLGV